MNYCSECAGPVRWTVPEGDDRRRQACESCGRVFYDNPRVVVGCLPQRGGEVLLCRRAIEPRHGFWTLPAGFMENGETLEQGALRETVEEAGAEVRLVRLFSVYSLPQVDQVYVIYLADLVSSRFRPGSESLEVALFPCDAIPWDDLAFRTIEFTLRHWVSAGEGEGATVHAGSLVRGADGVWTLHQLD